MNGELRGRTVDLVKGVLHAENIDSRPSERTHMIRMGRSGNLHDPRRFGFAVISRATPTNARSAGETCAPLGK
jgi:hypothetical protein